MKIFYMWILVIFFIDYVLGVCDNGRPGPFVGGEPLKMPDVNRSSNGVLDIVLTVKMAQVEIEWLCMYRRTYNGFIPGPTWIIKPNDTVRVKLVNELDDTPDDRKINELRFPNVTNLHTHGLHVSSKRPQDNVFVDVPDRDTGEDKFQYVYEIDEENSPGTYWYHAHLHGSTMFQVHSGLAGLIIVEDPTTGVMKMPQHLADISCPNNCEHDHSFIFQPILQYYDVGMFGRGFLELQKSMKDNELFRLNENTTAGVTLDEWLTDPKNNIDHFTTNGQVFPTLTIPSGQRKRFRLVHAGGDRTLELLITEKGGVTPTDACEVWEIAFDGIYLDKARKPRLGKSFLVPASKVDWIVVCKLSGDYQIRSVPDDEDKCSIGEFFRHSGTLVNIKVTGRTTTPPAQDTALPKRSPISGDFRHLHHSQVSGGFVVEANTRQHLNRDRFKSHDDYRHQMTVGKVQEWHLTNTDPEFGHPMHIHVNNFQIISYNNYTGPVSFAVNKTVDEHALVYYSLSGDLCLPVHQSEEYEERFVYATKFSLPHANETGLCKKGELVDHHARAKRGGPGTLGYVEPGEFRDVILVPPLSNITIRFLAHKFTGEVVIHCHILIHEDFGMMMTVYIGDEGENLLPRKLSGTAEPGKCLEPCTGCSVKAGRMLVMLALLFSFNYVL